MKTQTKKECLMKGELKISKKRRVKKVGYLTIYGFPFNPERPVTEKPPYYVAVCNGIIVKKMVDASKLIQWSIDHCDDKWFDLTKVEGIK